MDQEVFRTKRSFRRNLITSVLIRCNLSSSPVENHRVWTDYASDFRQVLLHDMIQFLFLVINKFRSGHKPTRVLLWLGWSCSRGSLSPILSRSPPSLTSYSSRKFAPILICHGYLFRGSFNQLCPTRLSEEKKIIARNLESKIRSD